MLRQAPLAQRSPRCSQLVGSGQGAVQPTLLWTPCLETPRCLSVPLLLGKPGDGSASQARRPMARSQRLSAGACPARHGCGRSTCPTGGAGTVGTTVGTVPLPACAGVLHVPARNVQHSCDGTASSAALLWRSTWQATGGTTSTTSQQVGVKCPSGSRREVLGSDRTPHPRQSKHGGGCSACQCWLCRLIGFRTVLLLDVWHGWCRCLGCVQCEGASGVALYDSVPAELVALATTLQRSAGDGAPVPCPPRAHHGVGAAPTPCQCR